MVVKAAVVPVTVVPDSVPLTVKPEDIVPLPLITKLPPAVMLPVVAMVGIEIVEVNIPVAAVII